MNKYVSTTARGLFFFQIKQTAIGNNNINGKFVTNPNPGLNIIPKMPSMDVFMNNSWCGPQPKSKIEPNLTRFRYPCNTINGTKPIKN